MFKKKSLVALAALTAIGESAGAGWSRNSSDVLRGNELRALNAGGLLANVDSATLNVNKFMQCFGDGTHPNGNIALAANPSVADVLRIMRIPAGTEVSAVLVANTDMDANGSPTFAVSIGFVPVNAADGPAANATYFSAAGETILQAPNAGKLYANFAPITFDKDVYLTMTVGAVSATFAAGTIRAIAIGSARGVR